MNKYLYISLLMLLLLSACNKKKDVEEDGNTFTYFTIDPANNSVALKGEKVACKIDEATGEITGITNLPSDITKLVVTFGSHAKSIKVGGTEQKSGITANDFSRPVTYKLTSAKGETKSYTVTIQNFTGLPVVYINTLGAAPINSKVDWKPGQIRIDGAGKFDNLEWVPMSIRGRGNTTWSYSKKPYVIRLDTKAEVLGMPAHKRWVLLANYIDRTLLRNRIAFKVAQATSLAWTPRSEFVDVILNGKHVGNYLLCEQIRVDGDRVDVKKDGFLLELDTYFDEVNKFRSDRFNLPFMIKSPDEEVIKPEQIAEIKDYVNTTESLLLAGNMSETREYASKIDVQSFVDWWIIHEVVRNYEPNHPKSCFMHKTKDGKLVAGPVWDFDWHTFAPTSTFNLQKCIWYKALFTDPEFIKMVKQRWSILKPEFEKIAPLISQEYIYIKTSADINGKMWPISDRNTSEDEQLSINQAVEKMEKTFRNKIASMNAEINKY